MIATLLFQPRFIRKMIEIGEQDGASRATEVGAFLGLKSAMADPRLATVNRPTVNLAA